MKVMLVDDHPLVRNGIASLLRARGYEVAAEASNGYEAIERANESPIDLVLMDIRMPHMGGLEATRLLKSRFPDMKIVMLTVSDDEQDLFEAVKSGAHGYMLKDLEAQEFYNALEMIGRNEVVLPSRLAGRLLDEFRIQANGIEAENDSNPLSLREQEVLTQVAQGLTNKDIASKLFISENTVKFHMKNILEKLHMRNRAQVIAWAARQQVSR